MISKRRFLGAKFLLVFIFSFFVFNANFGGLIVKDVANKMDNSNQYSYINNPETSGSLIMAVNAAEEEESTLKSVLSTVWSLHPFNWGTKIPRAIAGFAGDTIAKGFLHAVDWLLWVAFQFASLMLIVSAYILEVGLSDQFMVKMFSENSGIYTGWTIVRDFLNLFFLFALLFSAFATIFQVEKYHLKKILILLVVMALLVNFSYPISMFIIDFSNSAMFFIKDSVFGNVENPSASVANLSNLSSVFQNVFDKTSNTIDKTLGLITITIFTFMLVFIVAAYGFSLIVRWAILAMLVVFSPVGFAFAFFPSTKSIADSWWSNLFKYAIIGPLLLFFLMLAFVILGESVDPSGKGVITGGFSGEGFKSLIISLVAFSIPEIFLFIGFIMAQKMGGEAVSLGSKAANYARGKVTGAITGTAGTAWASTGIPGGVAARYGEIKDKFGESRRSREMWVAGKLGADTKDTERKKILDDAKKMKDAGTDATTQSFKDKIKGGDVSAAIHAASEGKLDADTYNGLLQSSKFKAVVAKDPSLGVLLDDKIKEKRIDVLIKAKYQRDAANPSIGTAGAQSNMENTLRGLSVDKWKHINFADFQGDPYIERAIKNSFRDLQDQAKVEIARSANSNSSTAMTNMGLI